MTPQYNLLSQDDIASACSSFKSVDPVFMDEEQIQKDLIKSKEGDSSDLLVRKKYVIYPGDYFKKLWDAIMTLTLILVLIYMPLTLAFG